MLLALAMAGAAVGLSAPVAALGEEPQATPPQRNESPDLTFGGHVHYAVGYGSGAPSGFRQAIDFGFHFAPHYQLALEDLTVRTWLVGVDCAVGLTTLAPTTLAPTTLALEGGYHWAPLAAFGLSVMAGPAVRVHPEVAAGAEVRAWFHLALLQIGVKASAVFGRTSEVQVLGLAGIGLTVPPR
ncbi:MAG: hypothetical protein QM765_04870 [Myxococcales bacterium]